MDESMIQYANWKLVPGNGLNGRSLWQVWLYDILGGNVGDRVNLRLIRPIVNELPPRAYKGNQDLDTITASGGFTIWSLWIST